MGDLEEPLFERGARQLDAEDVDPLLHDEAITIYTRLYGPDHPSTALSLNNLGTRLDKLGKPLKKPEVLVTKGLGINEAVAKIVGKPGTKVTITVQRPGEEKPREFTRRMKHLWNTWRHEPKSLEEAPTAA